MTPEEMVLVNIIQVISVTWGVLIALWVVRIVIMN
jgi:hypothetical protein